MDRPRIVLGSRHTVSHDSTTFQSSSPHRHYNHSAHHLSHKRLRSLSPADVDERSSNLKRRQPFNGLSQSTAPMLLSMLEETNPRFRSGTAPGPPHPYCYEPSSPCREAQQDVEMDCADESHQRQHEPLMLQDQSSLSWPVRSVHALRRVTPPIGSPIQTDFDPAGPPSQNLRPQPLHRPHPAAYQKHLALFSQRPVCPPTNDMTISPPRKLHTSHPGGSTHDQPMTERPIRPKGPVNYMLGPKKGCEDCRKKVAGHYTHL